MERDDTQRSPSPTRRSKQECCTDAPCDSGLRNQYFEGKRLTADSFRVEQSYHLERRHLLNRAIHGWGVVYGYAVKPLPTDDGRTRNEWGRLAIGPGLALDECGRELLQARTVDLAVKDAILLDEKGATLKRPPDGSYEPRPKEEARARTPEEQPEKRPDEKRKQACWLLSAHYAEQSVGPMRVNDPCSCERHEWERVCETVRFSLQRVDCEDCCDPFDCELKCGCGTGPCCEQHSEQRSREQPKEREGHHEPPKPPTTQANPVRRGGCQCLCEHVTGLSDVQCCGLRRVDDACAHIRADLCHGVPLACVRLRESECEGEFLFDRWIESCGPRRLVKRNDTLFDLIRGCDLTRISAIGWGAWHRSRTLVEPEDFEASFGILSESDLDRMRKSRDRREKFPVVTSKYFVEFSRPVRQDTVRADCFSMTVLVEEEEGGWDEAHRVPILDVATSAPAGTPAGLVTRATLIVDGRWLYDAVKGAHTIFDEDPTAVEIEIRGDLIVDCNGQTVDANNHGLSPAPTGNGTPGGTFFSRFRVQPRDADRRVPYENSDRIQGVQ